MVFSVSKTARILAMASFFSLVFFTACENSDEKTAEMEKKAESSQSTSDYDPNRGEGKYHEVKLEPTLDAGKAAEGEKIANVKCFSCHKTTEERLVGPGWKGITERKNPVWLMNFLTNPEPMLDKDPELQAQMEICLVRMPNQNINDDEARNILEFMRKIDGVK